VADLAVTIGPLALRNPVMTASGTCGYGMELLPQVPPERLGAVCVKGLSLAPRPGAAAPRIWEIRSAGGMLNAIGLANVGVDAFIAEKLPPLRARGATVIANVLGASPEEYAELARRLDRAGGVAALELNLSCPNVAAGGVHMSRDPALAASAVAAARASTSLPLIAKLSPEGEPLAVARAVAGAGADALSVCNTIRGMAIDVESRRPRLGSGYGGLSGPALRPIAVRLVHEVSRAVPLPVIGVGGVATWQDAVEMMLAGATAVQVGTALFADPRAPLDVLEGLEAYLDRCGEAARDLTGAVDRGR
jgi:dihydroorotate dehydrogenase (NAD+) catalytic subunit